MQRFNGVRRAAMGVASRAISLAAIGGLLCAATTSAARGHATQSELKSAEGGGANTFSGTCQMTGSVSFEPALTNSPQSVVQHARATGTCSGSFTDRVGRTSQLSDAKVRYVATERATNATCGAGTDVGTGALRFRYGAIRFSISEVRTGPLVTAIAQGARGGSAAGQGNVSPSANPVTILQQCAGAGLAGAPIDIRLASTPSISG